MSGVLVLLLLVPMALADDGQDTSQEAPEAEPSDSQNQTAEVNTTAKGNQTKQEYTHSEDVSEESSDTHVRDDRPCRLYAYEGMNPSISWSPLLGILTLDPDGCYQEFRPWHA